MSNNIYNILGKLKTLTESAEPAAPEATVYENVEPRGSITEAVRSLESKFATFKEAKAKPDFLDVDKDGNKKEPFKKAVKDKKAVKESADASTQKGANAIIQALSPEEEQQLAATVKQVGNNPAALAKALDITPELIQQAEQGQVAEGIAPTLGGKIVQALYTAGLLGTTVGAYATGNPWLGTIAAPLLMAAGVIYGSEPGQVGSKWDHAPDKLSSTGHYELKKGVKPEAPPAEIAHKVQEGQGPYELSNPKHPKFKANYDKWIKKNPNKKLADFVAAMKKKDAAMNEAAYDEPAAPDADAIAKRKRLQAIKDRQEDERAMGGKDETNTPIRKVAGKAYGGAAQKDAPEADLDEETSATGGEITKKGNVTTHKANKYGGAEEYPNNSGNSKDIMDRKSHNRVVDVGDPEDYDLDEVAPPGAKAERMVKHIKKGYSKDGKLSKKEKGIAYATAWKAHNKGQVEEGVEFKDAGKIKNSAPNMKKAKLAKVTEGRVMEETDYFYEKIGKALAEQNPHLDTATGEFVDAVRKEMVAQGIPPNRARGIILQDEDFISDVATSYGHYCTVDARHPLPAEIDLGNVKELDEIAALAGIPTPTAPQAKGIEQSADSMDETAPPRAVPGKVPSAKATGMAPAKPGVPPTPTFNEEDMAEGNEFSGALAKAKATGAKEFEVDGKRYTVKEDINVNITANGQEDALNLFRKLAGMDEVEAQPVVMDVDSAIAQGIVEPVEEERDIEYTNTPNEKIGPVGAAIPSGTDLNRSKLQDPETANRAANPLAVKEDTLWKKYSGMLKGLIK